MRKSILLFMAVLITATLWAQQRTITGKVTDAKGVPLAGATVTVRGTSTATQTDAQGNFSIPASQGNTLVISNVGYAQQEVRVGSSNALAAITLQTQGSELSEVVVTALGQTRSRDKVGYSASSFKADDVVRSAPVSVLDGLQGRVAGADISTIGGMPGSSSKIILRGYSSVGQTSNNQALIVVDGVPFNNSRLGSFNDFLNSGGVDFGNGLNDLNPNDIENVTILKGAGATSLYGSRASNGVVLITTKKGRSGRLTVDFNSSTIWSTVGKLPDFQNTFGQGWNGLHWKEENGSWGPRLDGTDRLWGSEVDNARLIKPFSAIEDNVRRFFDMGLETNNSISVRGGTDRANFYFSYANVYNNGVLPAATDVFRRNTLSLRGQVRTDRFLASASFNYVNRNGRTANTDATEAGSSTFENIIQIPRDVNIVDLKDYKNKFFNVDNYFTPFASNPYFSLFENGNQLANDRFFGNVELGWDFNDALNLRWRSGVDAGNARVKDYQALERPRPGSWRGPNPRNAESASLTALTGGVREFSDYARELNSDLFLNYEYDLNSNINLTGFVGANYNERESRAQVSRITGLIIPEFYDLSNSSNDPTTATAYSKRRLIGAFAQANLAFKDLLYVTLNARNDWSSTLPPGNNSFFYPAVNASAIISKMFDLERTGISFWKIRAAVGQTGKDAPVYQLASVGVSGNTALGFGNLQFPLNGITAFELGNNIGNSSLKPEITTEWELGTEIRFLKNRIGLDVAYYNKRTDGQIINVPIATSSGYTTLVTNFGLVENKGIELALNVTPVQTKDFTWSINYVFTKNNNAILELPAGLEKVDFNTYFAVKMVGRVGRPVGVIEAPKPQMTEDGRIIVNAANGFSVPTAQDQEYATVQRDYMMGLNNNFTYKNWSLGFSFDYRRGGFFVSRTADLTYFVGNAWLTQYNDRRPFIIPNSVVNTGQVDAQGKPIYAENTTPIDMTNINSYWYHTSNGALHWDRVILPKDFLKLRDITLTYRLPAAWAQKIKAQGASISVVGRNFLIWTPQKNTFIDPEVTNLGNDIIGEFGEQASAPTTRAYGILFRVNF